MQSDIGYVAAGIHFWACSDTMMSVNLGRTPFAGVSLLRGPAPSGKGVTHWAGAVHREHYPAHVLDMEVNRNCSTAGRLLANPFP